MMRAWTSILCLCVFVALGATAAAEDPSLRISIEPDPEISCSPRVTLENSVFLAELSPQNVTSQGEPHVWHAIHKWVLKSRDIDQAGNRIDCTHHREPVDAGSLNYRDHLVMAVGNPDNGVGFGRVMPIYQEGERGGTRTLKLLWDRGFETFPAKGSRQTWAPPYTGYLYAFEDGLEGAVAVGKDIVDAAAEGRYPGAGDKPAVSARIAVEDQTVVLENDLILARYAPADTGHGTTKTRIVEFRLKANDTLLADGLDGRHSTQESQRAYFSMTDATLEHDGPERKTVRLVFGDGELARVTRVSIFDGEPLLKLEYDGKNGHNLDYKIAGDTHVIYGAEAWQKIQGWPVTYPKASDREISEHGSFYRASWGDPGPLSYKGWFIMGQGDSASGRGAGLLLPHDRIVWLKNVGGAPEGSGFERSMKMPHTAFLYAVDSGGADGIIETGKKIVDRMQRYQTPGPAK